MSDLFHPRTKKKATNERTNEQNKQLNKQISKNVSFQVDVKEETLGQGLCSTKKLFLRNLHFKAKEY